MQLRWCEYERGSDFQSMIRVLVECKGRLQKQFSRAGKMAKKDVMCSSYLKM